MQSNEDDAKQSDPFAIPKPVEKYCYEENGYAKIDISSTNQTYEKLKQRSAVKSFSGTLTK
ncbi:hypothetical protein M513_07679 [Trichuris suis]|uniref:Uncharacterized protein n=1 Tax=Trichuris suis TaxID=68888 RepID=A0A085M2M0_9BILA|nr:hypothetical protein M513_07679 [Trichuris suis]